LSERRDLHYFIFTFVTARGSNWGAKFLVRKRRVVVIGKRDIFKVRRRVVVIGGLAGSGSRPPPIFSRTILIYRYPSPRGGAPSHSLDTSDCGTHCRCRIAVMRCRRDLSHACTQPVTCATLALEDFCPESDRQTGPPRRGVPVAESDYPHMCHSCTRGLRHRVRPTGRTPQRVCRSPSTSARPVVLAREGPPTLVNRPLLTEAWVALVRR